MAGNGNIGYKAIAAVAAAVLVGGGLASAPANGSASDDNSAQAVSAQAAVAPSDESAASSSDEGRSSSKTAASLKASSSSAASSAKASDSSKKTASVTSSLKAHKWRYSRHPNYYQVRGKAKTTKIAAGKIKLSKWDSLGRTRTAIAKVTYKMVKQSTGNRDEYDSDVDTISGWGHQQIVKVKLSNGRTYKGYAFNRSHLIADSLGGPASKENMITGTRTQNVGNNDSGNPGGMSYTETLARNYLYSHHNGWVYYRVTPVYKGSELVCRSVYVDIKSDDGSIDKRVEVFNAMNGYTLDYKTGKIAKGKTYGSVGAAKTNTSKKTNKKKSTTTSSSKKKYVYITKTGKKYHRAGCKWLYASKIKVTLSAAKKKGLTACLVCKP